MAIEGDPIGNFIVLLVIIAGNLFGPALLGIGLILAIRDVIKHKRAGSPMPPLIPQGTIPEPKHRPLLNQEEE